MKSFLKKYNIYTWNHTSQRWVLRFRNVRFWRALGNRLDRLRGEGWSEISVLVEAIDT